MRSVPIVGSIGVVGGSFGFDKLIDKLGIERRLYTSGEHKAMLDPFLPEKPEDVERLKDVQREIHDDFIALVKPRRAGKLNGPEESLFSGEYWTGRQALEVSAWSTPSAICARVLRATLRRQGLDAADPPERGFLGRALSDRAQRLDAGSSRSPRPRRGRDFGA